MKNKVIFIGAGPGDPDLITVKAKNILENAQVILFTGSLIPREVLNWAPVNCLIQSSEEMDYSDIFNFIEQHIPKSDVIRLHTGDTSLYSTIAKQIQFLNEQGLPYEIIPGITAAFAAAAELGIEYTLPGISQSLILSRIEGNTPNPEKLENILQCKNSSLVFYLSVLLLNTLKNKAFEAGYAHDTPCWVIEKATWPDQKIVKGTLENIEEKVKEQRIRKTALILLGNFLYQQETEQSHLYSNDYKLSS